MLTGVAGTPGPNVAIGAGCDTGVPARLTRVADLRAAARGIAAGREEPGQDHGQNGDAGLFHEYLQEGEPGGNAGEPYQKCAERAQAIRGPSARIASLRVRFRATLRLHTPPSESRVDELPVAYQGITSREQVANPPAWSLSGPGSVGVFCSECRKVQPVLWADPDLVCAVCVSVLLRFGEVRA